MGLSGRNPTLGEIGNASHARASARPWFAGRTEPLAGTSIFIALKLALPLNLGSQANTVVILTKPMSNHIA